MRFIPEIKSLYVVDYRELEEIILEVYGQELEIPCDLESSNDVARTFTINGNPLSSWDVESLEKWIENPRSESYMFGSIMEDLGAKGVLPIGDYVMEISW